MSNLEKMKAKHKPFDVKAKMVKCISETKNTIWLEAVLKSNNWLMIVTALRNPNVCYETKIKLVTFEYQPKVAFWLASYSDDKQLLNILSFSPDVEVRGALIRNPYTPTGAILRLWKNDSSESIRKRAYGLLERHLEACGNS